MKVRRALISVSDKTGLEELARGLVELGVQIISSGGTATAIAEMGLPVTPVDEVTGQSRFRFWRLALTTPGPLSQAS